MAEENNGFPLGAKILRNENMRVVSTLGVAMSKEIRRKKVESSGEGRDKLVIPMSPTPSDNANKERKTNTSVAGDVWLFSAQGIVSMFSGRTRAVV